MGRPRSRTPEQEKWIADLVREHGARGGARLATEGGVKIDPAGALRAFRLHYPEQSSDPAARVDAPAATQLPLAPAPKRPPDQELLDTAAQGDPESILQLALVRAAGLMGAGGTRDGLAVLAQIERLVDRIAKLRAAASAEKGKRVGILVLPAETAAPEAECP